MDKIIDSFSPSSNHIIWIDCIRAIKWIALKLLKFVLNSRND